jgi:DivIVA domain-containing protein
MENVVHTREEILNKDFKKTRIGTGYDMSDVDVFLDEIMADYQSFQTNMAELQAQNDKLKAQIEDLTKQISVSATPTKSAPVTSTNTNMDILKRLSNLERRVFGTPTNEAGTSENTTQVGE